MGTVKYRAGVRELFRRSPVVTVRDVATIVGSREYARLLLSTMARKGEIWRVTKGFYTTSEDPTVSVFCFRPAYIGLQDALSIRNLWEQETTTVIVTTQKVKKSMIRVFGSNVIVHRIQPAYMFGSEMVRQGGMYVPVSDVEKTLIDLVYFNEVPEQQVMHALKKQASRETLRRYLHAYPQPFRKRVLAFC